MIISLIAESETVSVWIDGTDQKTERSAGSRWTLSSSDSLFNVEYSVILAAASAGKSIRLRRLTSGGCGNWDSNMIYFPYFGACVNLTHLRCASMRKLHRRLSNSMRLISDNFKEAKLLLIIMPLTLPLLGCGFSTSYVSSAPTIGERTHGPKSIIRKSGFSIQLSPRNDLKTGEFNYFLLPIVPVAGNSDKKSAQEQIKGKFVVGLSLFAYRKNPTFSISDIFLELNGSKFKVTELRRHRYSVYPDSQARNIGDEYVLCPESQEPDVDQNIEEIRLTNDGLWQCYDLVFPVDAPLPQTIFQIVVVINSSDSVTPIIASVPFEPYQWGHSDSFP